LLIDAARPCRHAPGDCWFADETYVEVAGRWVYLYRAIDQFRQVIEVLVSEKRDLVATRRFFTRALRHGSRPTEVSTDWCACLLTGTGWAHPAPLRALRSGAMYPLGAP
jgi:transposase-like protein